MYIQQASSRQVSWMSYGCRSIRWVHYCPLLFCLLNDDLIHLRVTRLWSVGFEKVAIRVNHDEARDSGDGIFLKQLIHGGTIYVVLCPWPFLFIEHLFPSIDIFIDGQADDLQPTVVLLPFDHFLQIGDLFLAQATPGCPNVNIGELAFSNVTEMNRMAVGGMKDYVISLDAGFRLVT